MSVRMEPAVQLTPVVREDEAVVAQLLEFNAYEHLSFDGAEVEPTDGSATPTFTSTGPSRRDTPT